jgi:hypothetical protein
MIVCESSYLYGSVLGKGLAIFMEKHGFRSVYQDPLLRIKSGMQSGRIWKIEK